jgi:5-(carboxyamino)imidazole ribonucleotide synthase
VIVAGRKLGILGGGQLGTFFAVAARRLGYKVTVWDPDPAAPAGAWADRFIPLPFEDPRGLQSFLSQCEAVTYEWENIPVSLVEAIEEKLAVRPGSRVLRLLQNRVSEKNFLTEHHFPVTPFRAVKEPSEIQKAAEALSFPVICKTATAGYDGHGQWPLNFDKEADALSDRLQPRPTGWIVEKRVPYLKELSVVVARNDQGILSAYPVTDNRHEKGILRLCQIPALIEPSMAGKATSLAADVITALEGVGVFCIEIFLLADGALLVNEIAPRPHNSGHYSMDVCTVSQFEQQVRILCGLPLVDPQLLSPAVMVNILGSEVTALQSPEPLQKLLSIPNARIYHYRKQVIKAGRKMGHLTIADPDARTGMEKAAEARAILDRSAESAAGKHNGGERKT